MLKKLSIYIALILTVISLISPAIYCQTQVSEIIDCFDGFAGFFFQDVDTQEILLSYNHNRLFTPASLAKIFTALVALEIMGSDYQYQTPVYFSSKIPGSVQGDLYIKGTGDPTQSPELIKMIANKLVNKYDIYKIEGDIIMDDSLFNCKEFLGRGWMWDDLNPVIGAIPVKGYHTEYSYISYYRTMPINWGQLFVQELQRLGVQFSGTVKSGVVEKEARIKYIHYSEELKNIIAYMMKMSDNQSAELIFRSLPLIKNPGQLSSINLAIEALSETIFEILNIQWGEEYFIVDGCGLSEYNLLTPVQVVAAISYLFQQHDVDLLNYFANPSEKGTIKKRFPFQLWGKTGSLPSASGLAGILETKKNRQVVFCMMENNFRGEENDPKAFEDSIIEYVYNNY